MALPPSTANWHWKTKHVTPWARTWFKQELPILTVKGEGDEEASVEEVLTVEGDVELGQRKSKLITIYDCRLEIKWIGKTADGTEVNGLLTIPEVSHENTVDGLSEYEFDWTLTTASSDAVNKVYQLTKTKLRSAIEEKLAEFPKALVDTHGKDLTVSGEPSPAGTPQNGAATPVRPTSAAANAAPAAAPKTTKPVKAPAINTETIVVSANFQAPANELYSILTDEKRIPMWSRAPAQSKAEVGTEYSLFGGGVKGVYKSLTPSEQVVQSWTLNSPSWPSGHYATLTTTFLQDSSSTKLTLVLDGVPLGLEEETRRNLEGYYIGGLKSIGLGSAL